MKFFDGMSPDHKLTLLAGVAMLIFVILLVVFAGLKGLKQQEIDLEKIKYKIIVEQNVEHKK